ncbi:hypothetical protein NCG97_05260 [Streptomyces lydicamycinicus]|uniref:hypothetical protein n=1 Tax=Streptomyces lydicamycinicus TaxID=1546107 RepID=UPI002034F023|nr:hypothetical protein [Streptomyces lydicamycinicus]USA00223.1 hypothetical protein NCG97_05260 [Streptomyces lydicamycinicus]
MEPVRQALDAILAETRAATRAVAAATAAADARSAAAAAPREVSAPTTPRTSPPTPHRTLRHLSLETLPYVRDHCVYLQPEGWPEPADRFPVVPMTTLLELAAEAAREVSPGGLVTGYSGVRALRWLAVAPPVDLAVSATPEGDGRVRVSLGDHAAVTVHLAAQHPAPPPPTPRA